MPKFTLAGVYKNSFLIATLIFISIPTFSAEPSNQYCDQMWKEMQPKINELKKVIACDSSYTLQECRENIGLVAGVGIGAAAGAAAGYKAAQKVQLRPPQFCGIRTAQNLWKILLFPDVMAAVSNACNNAAVNGLLIELRGTVDADNAVREFQAGKLIQEQLKKENPQIVQAAKELEALRKDYFNTGELDSKGALINDASLRARLNEFEKKYGIRPGLTLGSGCTGNVDICDKLTVIYHSSDPINSTDKARGAYNRFKGEVGSSEIDAHHKAIKANNGFLKEIASGTVKTERDLAVLIGKVGPNVHIASASKVIDIVDKTKTTFPDSESVRDLHTAIHSKGGLNQNFQSMMKSDLKLKVKKSIPGILLGLFPVFANAAGCGPGDLCYSGAAAIDGVGEALDPVTWVKPTQLGCAEIYSTYSSLDSDCREEKGLTPPVKSFLFADETFQQEEVCKSQSFKGAIDRLYDETYPKDLKVTCSSGKVTMSGKSYGNTVATVDLQGRLTSVNYSGARNEALGGNGYIMNFDAEENLTSLTKINGRTRAGLSTQAIKRDPASLDPYLDHLSTRLPTVMASIEKCRTGNVDSNTESTASPPDSVRGGRSTK